MTEVETKQGSTRYRPQSQVLRWAEKRLPIGKFIYDEFVAYPTPRNLNFWWTFGAVLSFMLGVQIVTGIVLAMHYTPDARLAFDSVEHIMRDVNYGWLLRYLHSNGASFFFIAVYVHMFSSLYYGSYKEPRELLWILGVVLYVLMVATAFLGYTLVWGQMSFWAATVITNLFSAIPIVGESIVTWLWGGYAVSNPTLNRFFALHYLLPFAIVGLTVLHIWALHAVGQNNPDGIELKEGRDTVPFPVGITVDEGLKSDALNPGQGRMTIYGEKLPFRLAPGMTRNGPKAAIHVLGTRIVIPNVASNLIDRAVCEFQYLSRLSYARGVGGCAASEDAASTDFLWPETIRLRASNGYFPIEPPKA